MRSSRRFRQKLPLFLVGSATFLLILVLNQRRLRSDTYQWQKQSDRKLHDYNDAQYTPLRGSVLEQTLPANPLRMNLTELSEILPAIFEQPGYSWLSNEALSRQGNVYLNAYKLHYCKIDKNMGSTMQAVLCYIDDQLKHNRFFHEHKWGPGLGGTECGVSTSYGDLRERFLLTANSIFDDGSIRHITIIRDPIRRFLSAWLDVCSGLRVKSGPCFGCNGNLTCFVINNYYHIRDHALKRAPPKWHREWHFYPQSWYCDFEKRMANYDFIRYDAGVIDQIIPVFTERGIRSELVREVNATLRSKKAAHSTSANSDKFLRRLHDIPALLDIVRKTYHNDFRWFNYSAATT